MFSSGRTIQLGHRLVGRIIKTQNTFVKLASTTSHLGGFDFELDSGLKPNHDDLLSLSYSDPDLFWGTLAKSRLKWLHPYKEVQKCNIQEGQFSWFLNGKLNIAGEYACTLCKYKSGREWIEQAWEKRPSLLQLP